MGLGSILGRFQEMGICNTKCECYICQYTLKTLTRIKFTESVERNFS